MPDLNKIPPQAKEFETAVLGAMMLDRDALSVISILKPEMFYLENHAIVFEAMRRLFNKNSPVDSLTVYDELQSMGKLQIVGGGYFLTTLTNGIASSANIEYHAKIIHEKYLLRETIRICTEAVKNSFDDSSDAFEIMDGIIKDFLILGDVGSGRSTDPVSRISATLAQIEKAMQNKNLTGVPSGFRLVDTFTGGWQNGDLIVVAGRPGSGKTAFAIALARGAANFSEDGLRHYPVYIFSLEMANTQIGMREVGMVNDLKYSRLRTGKIEDSDWKNIIDNTDRFIDAPVYVDDAAVLNLTVLRSRIMKEKNEHKIKLCIIDYLNLMDDDNGTKKSTRYEKISEITRGVKRIAKELNIPIILLAQLNRDNERDSKTDKRPKLHHLRDSGTIEEASDIVMMMYRPAYYFTDPNFARFDSEGHPEDNAFYVDFAKHKQGATGEIKLYTEIEKNIFYDWDRQPSKVNFKNITEPVKVEDEPF